MAWEGLARAKRTMRDENEEKPCRGALLGTAAGKAPCRSDCWRSAQGEGCANGLSPLIAGEFEREAVPIGFMESGGGASARTGGAVQDGDDVELQRLREERRGVEVNGKRPAFDAGDRCLILADEIRKLSLRELAGDACFFEVVSHGA
jgi:hypothetical protein